MGGGGGRFVERGLLLKAVRLTRRSESVLLRCQSWQILLPQKNGLGMNSHFDNGDIGNHDVDGSSSMAGPFLGLATTLCLIAASWFHELEQGLRIFAMFLACITSIVTIRAALKRSKK